MEEIVDSAGVDVLHLDGLDVGVWTEGAGEPVLLLHGFPHTKELWRFVVPLIVEAGYRAVAPDLRGLGGSERVHGGYDAVTVAGDQVRLFDALGLDAAHVVGFDLGAAPAFALAAAHPERVRSLVVIEAVLGGLAGAEAFLASGGPWWFGFHQAPGGLAEDVVAGAEDRYLRFFLDSGSQRGVPEDLVRRFVTAYTGAESLRAAFDHYRAMPENGRWNAAWSTSGRLPMPVAALGAKPVGGLTARQLAPVSDDFVGHLIEHSAHIVPIDAPEDVVRVVVATARRAVTA